MEGGKGEGGHSEGRSRELGRRRNVGGGGKEWREGEQGKREG